MKILTAFGSTEGQTRKIAKHIDALIKAKNHSSVIYDCENSDKKPALESFDGFIVAGSVHQELHQPHVINFVKQNLAHLKAKPSAFVSVSLSAMLEGEKTEAEKYIEKFVEDTNWQPQDVHMAVGAIRFLEYDFFKRFTVQQLVSKGREMPDPSVGNPEYTDWEALDSFVVSFLEKVK